MTEVETILSVVRIHAGDDSRVDENLTLRLSGNLPTARDGKLYHVDQYPNLTAKIYDIPGDGIENKLRAMLDSPPDIPDDDADRVSIVWPLDILKDRAGSVVGLLMPRFSGKPMREVFGAEGRDDFALEAARNLSKAIDILHEGPHVIGDFHESYVLASDSAAVTLIDTDLFHIYERQSQGGRTYRSRSGRGEYTPPELQGSQYGVAQSERDHDLFALAVVIYKLLMNGDHPFDGDYSGHEDPPPLRSRIQSGYFLYSGVREIPYRPFPDSKSWDEIPDSLRDLFLRCFEDGHDSPRSRPSAHEWTLAIEELIVPAPEDDLDSSTSDDLVQAESESAAKDHSASPPTQSHSDPRP